jgi:hypothetical protein
MRTYAALAVVATALFTSSLSAQPGVDNTTPVPPVMGEPVTIKSGSLTLSGIIETPAANGQHSAVVIVASGQSSAAAKEMAKAFAKRGVIALTYDAPEANVSDVRAAVEVLRVRGDVKREQIGIVGVGVACSVLHDLAKADGVHYLVAVRGTKVATSDPVTFNKLSQKVLVVQGVADPFSTDTEKYGNTLQKKARNVTFWPASDDDIGSVGGQESSLLNRITEWAAAREV